MSSSIFDMIGPVMIGPSSSHTAGVVRIGQVARQILGSQPEWVEIVFYNSFARTYEGHGSDRAIIGGLLDFPTDDIRLRNALDLAAEQNLAFHFKSMGNASTFHPNTVKINLRSGTETAEIIGESRGGGLINIAEVNGFRADFSAQLHTLMIEADDVKGTIAFIADVLANEEVNIATMNVSRKGKNDLACHFIETDTSLPDIALDYLRHLRWVKEVTYIAPVT
jgi:L-serine dehydratase